jgi:hypothetical protein
MSKVDTYVYEGSVQEKRAMAADLRRISEAVTVRQCRAPHLETLKRKELVRVLAGSLEGDANRQEDEQYHALTLLADVHEYKSPKEYAELRAMLLRLLVGHEIADRKAIKEALDEMRGGVQ